MQKKIMAICIILATTGVLYCLWDGRVDIRIGNIIVIESKRGESK
jgi:hypothetical protein